jgi:hypothetical protein
LTQRGLRLTKFPETANRHLEDLDLLFAGESHLSWRAEKEFAQLKSKEAEHVEDVGAGAGKEEA